MEHQWNINDIVVDRLQEISSSDIALLSLFEKNVLQNSKLNDLLPSTPNGSFRIMLWNIRYFTNAANEPSSTQIINVIEKIDPDLICLNEATIGYNDYSEELLDFFYLLKNYHMIAFCNNVPSWFASTYGNMILIKKKIMRVLLINPTNYFSYNLCTSNTKCFLNQRISVYKDPVPIRKDNFDNYRATETRCFVKISLGSFDVICTHLEAYQKETRKNQFIEMMTYVTRKTIIMGDFNIINTTVYKNAPNSDIEWEVIKQRNSLDNDKDKNEIVEIKQKYNLKDAFELKNITYNGFTSWTNTIVDYMLFTSEWTSDEVSNIFLYFTMASDHIPMFIDLNENFVTQLKMSSINLPKPISDHEVLEMPKFINKLLNTYNINVDINKFTGWGVKPYKNSDVPENYGEKPTDLIFCNCQPLAAYDWFSNNGSVNVGYDFKDPYITGNFELVQGREGVYVALNNIEGALHYISTLNQQTDQISFNDELINVSLLFQFKIVPNHVSDVKIVTVETIGADEERIRYKTKFDNEYDIICRNILGEGITGKLTKREYDAVRKKHNYFYLDRIDIVVFDKIKRRIDETINEADNRNRKIIEATHEKIKIALDYINNKQDSKQLNKHELLEGYNRSYFKETKYELLGFINNTDVEDFAFSVEQRTISLNNLRLLYAYPIWKSSEYKQEGGKYENSKKQQKEFTKKYYKYKSKYVNLKNKMNTP